MKKIQWLSDALERIPPNYVVLVEVPAEQAQDTLLQVLQDMEKRGVAWIIVNSIRPLPRLLEWYRSHDLSPENFFFIDIVTKSPSDMSNVEFIGDPSNLFALSVALENACARAPAQSSMALFDSLNTLLFYNDAKTLIRFVHSSIIKIRLKNIGAVLFLLKDDDHSSLRAEIAHLCDKMLKI